MTIGSTPPVAAPQPTSNDKRLQLQTMLLRKSLDLQAKETEAPTNSISGKGAIIDLRV
ncbi:MAG: hypothetical protein ACYC96_11295 [Fimbriimonadaceae bacterium]